MTKPNFARQAKSQPCPICNKPFSKRHKQKIGMLNTRKPGRPLKYDYAEIRKTKQNKPNLTYRQLAAKYRCSIATIQSALQEGEKHE